MINNEAYTTRETYYLTETDDEYNPVSGSRDECAQLLSDGVRLDPEESAFWMDPAKDGETYDFSVKVYTYVPVEKKEGAYQIPKEWPGKPFALAYGDGMGWNVDLMLGYDKELPEMLAEYGDEDIEYVACLNSEAEVTLVYRDGALFEAS